MADDHRAKVTYGFLINATMSVISTLSLLFIKINRVTTPVLVAMVTRGRLVTSGDMNLEVRVVKTIKKYLAALQKMLQLG